MELEEISLFSHLEVEKLLPDHIISFTSLQEDSFTDIFIAKTKEGDSFVLRQTDLSSFLPEERASLITDAYARQNVSHKTVIPIQKVSIFADKLSMEMEYKKCKLKI